MTSLPRITEESASSRKGLSLSSASGPRGSASSLKRGTTGLAGAYTPPFNFEVRLLVPFVMSALQHAPASLPS